jgi:peroxiredoxin
MRAACTQMVVFLVLLSLSSQGLAADPASVGAPAPAFTLTDAGGKTHSLTDFKGKYVVLEWVNFGCPFVRKHYDSGNMQELQKLYTGKGVAWLSVCSSAPGKQGYFEGKELTERIAAEKSMATAYLVDKEGTVGQAYGAKTTPHMFIINPQGTLIYAGGIDDRASTNKEDIKGSVNYVRETLDAAMNGKPVKVSTSRSYGCSVKYK